MPAPLPVALRSSGRRSACLLTTHHNAFRASSGSFLPARFAVCLFAQHTRLATTPACYLPSFSGYRPPLLLRTYGASGDSFFGYGCTNIKRFRRTAAEERLRTA